MKKSKRRSRVEEIAASLYGENGAVMPAAQGAAQRAAQAEQRAENFREVYARGWQNAPTSQAREIPLAEVHAVYARVLATIAHPRLLSPRELADISGVSMKDIYQLFKSKRLRGWRVPGRKQIKFTLEELLEAMIPVVNE